MSTEREYEAGAYGIQAAGGAPGVQPNVYHPQPAPAPAYEQYADPAAAHGWQNAYDDTRVLAPLAELPEPLESPEQAEWAEQAGVPPCDGPSPPGHARRSAPSVSPP
ncbi:hypothetical protein ABZY21_28260, partial [Streptomyces cinerochromogenes]